MAELSQDQIRAVDLARTRLQTLHTAMSALRGDLASPQQPMPSWSLMQTHTNLIAKSIEEVSKVLSDNQELFSSTVAFPLPSFPGRYQSHIIETLLRTKLEPRVEDWIEQGSKTTKNKSTERGLSDRERSELWQWAGPAANREARKQIWDEDYTIAEKRAGTENVATGLNRKLRTPPEPTEENESDEEDQYDYESEEEAKEDKMEVEAQKPSVQPASDSQTTKTTTAPQMSLDSMLKFATTGNIG